jgi:hypothetical protein
MGDKVEVSTLVLSQVRERERSRRSPQACRHIGMLCLRCERRAVTGGDVGKRGAFQRCGLAPRPSSCVWRVQILATGCVHVAPKASDSLGDPRAAARATSPSPLGPHAGISPRAGGSRTLLLLSRQAGPVELQQTGADQGYLRPLVPVAVSHQHEPLLPIAPSTHTPSPLCCSAALPAHIAHTKPPSLPIINVNINT